MTRLTGALLAVLILPLAMVGCTSPTPEGDLPILESIPMSETPSPTVEWWHPTPGLTWQWQLGSALDFDIQVDIWDIDLGVHKSVVDKLHSLDAKVICYISVGSHENWRTDADQFPEEVL